MNDNYVFEITDEISQYDFLFEEDYLLFDVIVRLQKENIPISKHRIVEFLKKEHNIEPFDKIENILLQKASETNLKEYIANLKDFNRRIRLLNKIPEISKKIENTEFEQFAKEFDDELDEVRGNSEFANKKDQINNFLEQLEINYKKKNKEDYVGFKTYIKSFDEKTLGLEGGSFNVVAARPAMGKTALVLSFIANNIIKNKKSGKILFFSLEMPADQLISRLVSMISGVPLVKIRKGELDETEYEKILKTTKIIENSNLIIEDKSKVTIFDIVNKAKKIAKKEKLELVVIDYIQLISGHLRTNDRRLIVDEISRQLKVLAKDNLIPVIGLSQLNRDLERREDKRPTMADIRESGAIEQDADRILFVYRDSIYKEAELKKEKKEEELEKLKKRPNDVVELIMAKQRQGPTGTTFLNFVKRTTLFKEAPNDVELKTLKEIQKRYISKYKNNKLVRIEIFDIELNI